MPRRLNGLGQWDDEDYTIDGKATSVKSTKSYGQLLLLESKDYDQDGVCLPNKDKVGNSEYDYFVLIRMEPFYVDIMKREIFLFSDSADYNMLMDLIEKQEWRYDSGLH